MSSPSLSPHSATGAGMPPAPQLSGNSLPMQALRAQIGRIARCGAPVAIRGESGTGKELAARAIHAQGARASFPFIAVNCGAIPEALMEAEFFGCRPGAYTGALHERQGLFQAAHGGSLLLDEVDDLPLAMQVKLLRVLQERRVRKLGGSTDEAIDVRILCASQHGLARGVAAGTFRQDLFYRLNVIELALPPLRERRGDLQVLCEVILARLSPRRTVSLAPPVLAALAAYAFPGNVRELENVLERAAIISGNQTILPKHLPADMVNHVATAASEPISELNQLALPQAIEALERRMITAALAETHGNKSRAAKLLEISERSLWYKLSQYDIS